ncbi:hypothetical protein EON66_06255 [archaeon]|nr:MAG: hypothetical protein EON66_06255 [archaeon]
MHTSFGTLSSASLIASQPPSTSTPGLRSFSSRVRWYARPGCAHPRALPACARDQRVPHPRAIYRAHALLQRPFVHYMAMIALMYEASTPFLHIRKIMIQARTTDNVAYTVVTVRALRVLLPAWAPWT